MIIIQIMYHILLLLLTLLGLNCSEYVPTTARELAVHSIMVYEPQDQLKKWNCYQCHEFLLDDRSFWYVKSHNLFGMAGYSPNLKAIVLVFRGTQSKSVKNFATDLDMTDKTYPNCQGCKVHKGFYEAFEEQFQLAKKSLNSLLLKYPNAPIYVTGHSLGGAIAALTAAELSLQEYDYNLATVYTFGKPRVGNKKFASWFDDRLEEYRIIHYKDIVPANPPRKNPLSKITDAVSISIPKISIPKIKIPKIHFAATHLSSLASHQNLWDFEYNHEGKEVWFDKEMKKYQICESEDSKCFNSVKINNPLDHLKKYYIAVPCKASLVSHFSHIDVVPRASHLIPASQ